MDLSIRKFNKDDAKKVSDLIRRTMTIDTKGDYPQKTTDWMVKLFSPEKIIEMFKERDIYLLVNNEEIIGTGNIDREGHFIHSLFINPDYQKKGCGRMIMEHLENIAKEKGEKKIELFASITGFEFYKRIGYKKIKEVMVENIGKEILMEKEL